MLVALIRLFLASRRARMCSGILAMSELCECSCRASGLLRCESLELDEVLDRRIESVAAARVVDGEA